MSYQTTIAVASSGLPIELADAKKHLRILSEDLDTEVLAALAAAVDYCEGRTGRALRVDLNVTQTYWDWPYDRNVSSSLSRYRFDFDRQPVKSITSITYYDSDGEQQTVDASSYRLTTSTHAAARLEFDNEFSIPDVFMREDAIALTYVAGYEDEDSIPAKAKYAIKLKMAELFGDLDPRMVDANRRACDDLLDSLDWGSYR